MKVRFNHYERIAGMFVVIAISAALISAVSVAIKQGWFEPRVKFQTIFENADGVREGTTVKMAGINAGSVESVDLLHDNRVRVTFHVLGKYRNRIRTNSRAVLIRPFIIGDRVLEVSVGSADAPLLAEKSEVASEESTDMMTFLSGRKMSSAIAEMGKLMESLQMMTSAFSDPKRVEMIIRMFDHMEPLLLSLNKMSIEVTTLSGQVNEGQVLRHVLKDAQVMLAEMNRILPEMNKQNPEFGSDVAKLMKSMAVVSRELEVGFNEVGPQVPNTARRIVELMNETTVLVKAMQKNMFIRGSVAEVREQEAEKRLPASSSGDPKK